MAEPPKPIYAATMRWLIEQDPLAHLRMLCLNKHHVDGFEQHQFKNHHGSHLLAATVAAWFGLDATVGDVRRMAVCVVCGARAPDILVEPYIRQPGFSAAGYAWPTREPPLK